MEFKLNQEEIKDGKIIDVKTHEIEMDNITEKDLEKYEELFCHCEYKHDDNNPPKYVENYNGVNHGWICPECKKFIQVG